ncbi:MAG: ACT domain-containing protein [Methylococcales bacterium]
MQQDMKLVITALGGGAPMPISELLHIIRESEGKLLECRISSMGAISAAYLFVEGNWHKIAKLENMLESFGNRHHLALHFKRDETDIDELKQLPYTIDVISADRIGLADELAKFFLERDMTILDLTANRYSAVRTELPLVSIRLIIGIPLSHRIISLRDEFLDYCDEFNLDAVMEPVKP